MGVSALKGLLVTNKQKSNLKHVYIGKIMLQEIWGRTYSLLLLGRTRTERMT
jgi:hypothetical protein